MIKDVVQTKRGKNNPNHMFIKPYFDTNPGRMISEPDTAAGVAVGTYDTQYIKSMSSKEQADLQLKQSQRIKYDAL